MKIVTIGSTGAVGTEVIKNLVRDERVNSIKLFVRTLHAGPEITASKKVQQVIVDVFKPSSYRSEKFSIVLFENVGTA
jgi:aspartate-semialdehyde dehydrogenase